MNPFASLIQRFGLGRLVAILGVSGGVAAAFFALVLNAGAQPKSLLYSNLDLKEAGSITAALDQANVKYELKGDGSTILVPRDKVASTRLMLSGKGLPTSGSVGYEIFDSAPALGQTDFVQNLNRQRALEGELARTIRSLQGVTAARVHLVLPRRQLFEDEAGQPSASVVIGAGREPGAEEVRAIRNLVAGAVPDLKPERVTIVDDKGKMLAGGDANDMASQAAEGQRSATEERVRQMVRNIVEGVVGPGKARVQVTADVDLNRVTTSEEKFDPDGQVIRSERTVEANSKDSKGAAGQAVSTANNIPGADATAPASVDGNQTGSNESVTNYEISKTTRTEVQEPGTVKRLSVAVAVDGVTTIGPKGKVTYAPRSADDMKRIESLVRSAVGFDAARQDQVTVVNVRFSHDEDAEGVTAGNPLFGFDKNDMMRGGELLVLLIVAAMIVFFVARPLMKGATGAGGGLQAMPMLTGSSPGTGTLQIEGAGGGAALASGEGIDMTRIEGQVKASSVKQIAEFVDKHPDESVSILRSWLHETA